MRRTESPEGRPLPERPDLLGAASARLSRLERFNLWLIRRSFEPGVFDRLLRLCQVTVGQAWIHHTTKNLRHVLGRERLRDLDSDESVLVVSNHRSFFDLYIVTAELVRAGLRKRVVFPVRSRFFYDHPLGFAVNLWAGFLAMYPPIFRQRSRAPLNLLALDELAFLLARGGVFAGLHPEGTRNQGDDPYSFLPAQPGVGRVILKSRVRVIPVFISGPGNDLRRQIASNFDGSGQDIVMVFGDPIDFGDLLEQRPSPRAYKAIATRCMEAIAALTEEERAFRRQRSGCA